MESKITSRHFDLKDYPIKCSIWFGMLQAMVLFSGLTSMVLHWSVSEHYMLLEATVKSKKSIEFPKGSTTWIQFFELDVDF
jgi:hypothetical protein